MTVGADLEDAIADRMKDAMSEGLKVYFEDFQGEYKELNHVSEVNLTPVFDDFISDMERIFGKRDYKAERKKWIKRYRKIGKKM